MKADVILADPAWKWKARSAKGYGKSAERHYPTMETADIAALPVADVAAKNCALFMWATFPRLPDALAVGAAWGFTYKTGAFVWVKQNRRAKPSFLPVSDPIHWFMSTGYYTRSNAELCLLFTRGRVKRLRANVRQLIISPVREHSRKPDEQYERIEALLGCDGSRLELFARQSAPGWMALGNQMTGNDLKVDLKRFADMTQPAVFG